MSLNKDKLIFDETDIDSSDQVGSHLLGTGNEKISSTNIGGKEGLDVNIISTITVQSEAEYAEDSAHTSGDIGIHMLAVRQDVLAASTDADGDYSSFKVTSTGELYVADKSTLAELVAVNSELDAQTALLTTIDASLDVIEAIDFATETTLLGIKAQTDQLSFDMDGRLEVVADIRLESDIADDAPDTENPFKMGSRAVSGLLTQISASGDKANVISDMYRRVYVNDAPNVGFSTAAQSVTTTASEIAATPLAGRKRIMIQNLGNRAVFIGFDSSVTASSGLRVSAGAFLEMPFGEDLDIYAIADSGSQDVRVVQIA